MKLSNIISAVYSLSKICQDRYSYLITRRTKITDFLECLKGVPSAESNDPLVLPCNTHDLGPGSLVKKVLASNSGRCSVPEISPLDPSPQQARVARGTESTINNYARGWASVLSTLTAYGLPTFIASSPM